MALYLSDLILLKRVVVVVAGVGFVVEEVFGVWWVSWLVEGIKL